MQKELDKIEKNAGRVAEQQNMAKSTADVLMKDVKVYHPTAVAAMENICVVYTSNQMFTMVCDSSSSCMHIPVTGS